MQKYGRLFFNGFSMGSADIVPGVSGGTMAFIFGIYEELLESIKIVSGEVPRLILKGKIKEAFQTVPFGFLIPLGAGILTAIVTLSNVISYLLANQPVLIWSFFFGLIVASVFLVSKRIVTWDVKDIVALLLSAIGAYFLVGAVPVSTPASLPLMFVAGAIAICAMILPGISGSFLLVIMGKYDQVLQAVIDKDIVTLVVFMAGAVLGLALFSRLLSYLFEKQHDLVVSILIGFMIGSLRKVWPWKEVLMTRVDSHGEIVPVVEANVLPGLNMSLLFAMILCALGIWLMFMLNKVQATKEVVTDIKDPEFTKEHKHAVQSQKH